jgi:TATA-box binding protein (TBP) (component of TFIID and TFIIIB)
MILYIHMKLKLLSLVSVVLMALASQSFAGDLYRINNPNSLVTANRGDLEVFMALNARHMKQAVRDLYNRLAAQGALFNLQPGMAVEATMYYDDGTAKIEWGNGEFRGFINKDDLSSFLGSNSPQNIWANTN